MSPRVPHSPCSSIDSLQDPLPDVPGLSGPDSASRLILLPNIDDHDPLQEYSTDEEDSDEDVESQSGINQLSIQPFSPSVVFLYLLSPYLRLGAMYAFDIGDVSLAYALTALIVAASLSAFCRHIWFLLSRYVRKSSTEDVLLHTFARRHRRDGWARHGIITISGLFKILLAAMYLRNSVDSALLLSVPEWFPSLSRLNISILLSILVFVLSLPRSLASKTIIRATVFSLASYLAWLVTISRAYGANKLGFINLSPFRRGVLWNEIASFTFACTTATTVPLSASLIAGTPLVPPASRNARTRSFELLNVLSTILAALLLLPLALMAAPHRAPDTSATLDNLVLGLRIATLSLSIPSVVVSIISLPLHGVVHRYIHTDLALSAIVVAIFALSLIPPSVASTFDDVALFLTVSGTFLLPALTHIIIHYFRRPLSIVISNAPPSAPTTPHPSSDEHSPSPSRDPLLQRKELLLQRSRMGKRLLWDIVIWGILLPICCYAFVWAVGRIAQQW